MWSCCHIQFAPSYFMMTMSMNSSWDTNLSDSSMASSSAASFSRSFLSRSSSSWRLLSSSSRRCTRSLLAKRRARVPRRWVWKSWQWNKYCYRCTHFSYLKKKKMTFLLFTKIISRVIHQCDSKWKKHFELVNRGWFNCAASCGQFGGGCTSLLPCKVDSLVMDVPHCYHAKWTVWWWMSLTVTMQSGQFGDGSTCYHAKWTVWWWVYLTVIR